MRLQLLCSWGCKIWDVGCEGLGLFRCLGISALGVASGGQSSLLCQKDPEGRLDPTKSFLLETQGNEAPEPEIAAKSVQELRIGSPAIAPQFKTN